MTRLTITHKTTYNYHRPVTFGEHRMMFRPRDSHDLRLIDTRLTIRPHAEVRWLHDVFGNSTAVATFADPGDELCFESVIEVEHYGVSTEHFPIEEYARTIPFSYSADEIPDLGRTTERHYPDAERQIDTWTRQFIRENGKTDTETLLIEMTRAIKEQFSYTVRDEIGTQPPVQTLQYRAGSCRDFALLMMEAVRSLGLAARFVSGYLYDPAVDRGGPALSGAGATHAWAEVYLPGAGWVQFDPTNGLIGGTNLIRVAVARDPSQAVPLQGSYNGAAADFDRMTVDVKVTAKPLLSGQVAA